MKLTTFLPLIMVLILCNTSYTQETSWVSISNEYISISVDKVTGRYIIYDATNSHIPSKIQKSFFPKNFLAPASPNDSTLSPLLGDGTNAFNVTTFNIDGTPVVFGSSSGRWVDVPTVNSNSICYIWQIGTLNIIQRLEIITNFETLTPDAVEISYDVFNNHSRSQQVQARMVLDTIINDGQSNTFFLPNNQPLVTEYSAALGVLPDYWMTSDHSGNISYLSLKSSMSQDLKPNYFHITTIDRALKDVWEFTSRKNNKLIEKDVAVVMFFDNNNIAPKTSKRIASTVVGVPSLMNTFQNNGLEARTSSFVRQSTLPVYVTLWLHNTSSEIFDNVELELQIPNSLTSYDLLKQQIPDLSRIVPVTWRLDTDAKLNDNYNILAIVKGYKNGRLVSIFDVPLLINIDPQLKNSALELANTIKNAQDNAIILTNKNTVIPLEQFSKEDTLGSTSASLSKIYQHLQDNENIENKKLTKMIETEQQLIKEILEIDNSLKNVDNQYIILTELYKRLYSDETAIDREQINIQGLMDHINDIESTLLKQEKAISNMISR